MEFWHVRAKLWWIVVIKYSHQEGVIHNPLTNAFATRSPFSNSMEKLTSSQFPLIIRPGNSRTLKWKAQRSTKSEWQIHTTENLSLLGLLPFFYSRRQWFGKVKSHHVMCVGGWWMCVENDGFNLHPQIWFMPDGQTNGKRKERFLPSTLCVKEPRLIISSISIMMIIYLCFSKHDSIFTLHLSLSFPAQCVSVYSQKTHFPTLIVYRFPTSRGSGGE